MIQLQVQGAQKIFPSMCIRKADEDEEAYSSCREACNNMDTESFKVYGYRVRTERGSGCPEYGFRRDSLTEEIEKIQ